MVSRSRGLRFNGLSLINGLFLLLDQQYNKSNRESVRRSSSESGFISFVVSGFTSSPFLPKVKIVRLMKLTLLQRIQVTSP